MLDSDFFFSFTAESHSMVFRNSSLRGLGFYPSLANAGGTGKTDPFNAGSARFLARSWSIVMFVQHSARGSTERQLRGCDVKDRVSCCTGVCWLTVL